MRLFFVCFARVGLCLFPLPLGVRDWLRLVIVALSGVFFLPVNSCCSPFLSVVSYVTNVLSLFALQLSFFWCLRKLWDLHIYIVHKGYSFSLDASIYIRHGVLQTLDFSF